MDKRIAQIDRSYVRFLNVIGDQPIANYYGLSNEISVTVSRISLDCFMVLVNYENKPPLISQLELPLELHYYIKSFLHKKNVINSQIRYPDQYPWRSPIWTHTISNTNPITSKQLVRFNAEMAESWLPCSIFEQDILYYLVWLLDFL